MKKLILVITAAIALLVFRACKDKEQNKRKDGFSDVSKNKEDSLFHEVMEGHDIGMARMIKITKYLTHIQNALDSINRLPAAKIDEEYQQTLIDLQEDLNYAQYGMNTWMDEFKHDSAQENKEKRIQYLESEKIKVIKVKEAILGSLQRADSIFIKKK
ncbi:MAG TPA: hypothetical protein VIS75_08215 [Chitinophagaceae bacterium]